MSFTLPDGKIARTLPEQVQKNMEDIDKFNAAIQEILELANGLAKALVLSDNVSAITEEGFESVQVFDEDGKEIETWEDYQELIDGRILGNSMFALTGDTITLPLTGATLYYFLKEFATNKYVVFINFKHYKTGDFLLITETNVPDRWFDYGEDVIYFRKLEGKIDLNEYAKLNESNNFEGAQNNFQDISLNDITEFNRIGTDEGGWFVVYDDENYNFPLTNLGDITPHYDSVNDIGSSSKKWKDFYLSGTIKATKGSDSNLILINNTFYVGIDSNNALVFGQPNNDIRFYSNNIRFATPLVRPQTNNITDLGSNSVMWKDLYLAGDAYFSSGKGFKCGGQKTVWLYTAGTHFGTHVNPITTKTYDLGTPSYIWKDLYLSGKISDGKSSYGLTVPDTTSWTANQEISTKGSSLVASGTFSAGDISINKSALSADGLYFFVYSNCQAFMYITSAMLAAINTAPLAVPIRMIYDALGHGRIATLRIDPDPNDNTKLILTIRDQNDYVMDALTIYIYKTNLL